MRAQPVAKALADDRIAAIRANYAVFAARGKTERHNAGVGLLPRPPSMLLEEADAVIAACEAVRALMRGDSR